MHRRVHNRAAKTLASPGRATLALKPLADAHSEAVRQALLDTQCGRRIGVRAAVIAFSTRQSSYRLLAGRVVEATDTSLVGAELIGWLVDESGKPQVVHQWRARARAVMMHPDVSDRAIVTSTTSTYTAELGRPISRESVPYADDEMQARPESVVRVRPNVMAERQPAPPPPPRPLPPPAMPPRR